MGWEAKCGIAAPQIAPRRSRVAWLYIAVSVTLLAGCTLLKQAKLYDPVSYGMEQIAPRVYVSKEVPDAQRRELLNSIEQARNRVTAFYGSLVTDPVVYGCAVRACIESFGGVGDGYAAVKLPGILLWTKSFIPEAIAHEWSHLELFFRIGSSGMRTVPMWFNEGLATVVGGYAGHSEAVWQEAVSSGFLIPPMSDLRTPKQWGEAFRKYSNPKGLNVVYATSGHEVRVWLQRVGHEGLFTLIETIESGVEFSAAYDKLPGKAEAGINP